jgi:hypothetical protein
VVCRAFYGLQASNDAVRTSREQQLQQYQQLYGARDRVLMQLADAITSSSGKATASSGTTLQGQLSVADLTAAVCGNSTGPGCSSMYLDVLNLLLLPGSYSSNSTTDTGGFAYIGPAQDQKSCNAAVTFAGTAAAEAALATAMRQNFSAVGLSEQDVSWCR